MASVRESTVVYIACEPPAILWSGIGNIMLPADEFVPTTSIALGGGELVSVPDFQQLIGGTAERLDFTVSGVSGDIVRLAIDDAESVKGARVDVGTIKFDDDWQTASITWEQVFEARTLTVSRPQASGSSVTRSITLTIVQGNTTRSRAKVAYFTDADQRRRSSDDDVFSHVAGINMGTSRRFGPN